jgi:hypothetical protein
MNHSNHSKITVQTNASTQAGACAEQAANKAIAHTAGAVIARK